MTPSPVANRPAPVAILLGVLLGCSLLLVSCIRTTDGDSQGTGTATLSWETPTRNVDGSRLDGLAGYTIYYGTDPRALTHAVRVTDPHLTHYEVRGLASGTYYFSIAAFTMSGRQSGLGPVVSKIIPPPDP